MTTENGSEPKWIGDEVLRLVQQAEQDEPPNGSSSESSTRTCLRCKTTYALRRAMGPNGICLECIEEEMRADAFVEEGLKRCGIPQRFTAFENWDELKGSPAYLLAVSAVRSFTVGGGSVMAVVGPRGTGKTQAACMALFATIRAGRASRYTTAFKLFADLKGRYGAGGNAECDWLKEWSIPHLLVVDEIAERHGTEHELTALTSLVDERYGAERPTILVGNIEADGICDALGSSISDRCNEGGGVVEFSGWKSFRGA